MLIDASFADVPTSIEAGDVVIVGAGTVGLLLAKLLASRGLSVVILEAGNHLAAATEAGQ